MRNMYIVPIFKSAVFESGLKQPLSESGVKEPVPDLGVNRLASE